MSFEPRDRGGPIQKYWDDDKTIKQLDSVKTWLMKSAKKVNDRVIAPLLFVLHCSISACYL